MTEKSGKPDIFYVIGSLLVGGAEKHISMVAPALVRRGHRVVVYNLSGESVLGEAMADAGVKVISPPFRLRANRLRIVRGMALAVSSLKLFLLFLFKRPPIVHFFLPQAYIVGAIAARCAGLSGLIMSRRSLNAYQAHHPMLARLERRLHQHMSLVIANSKRVLAQLRDDENVPADKLGLIHNGIELGLYDRPLDAGRKRTELGIDREAKVLVVVANLIPYKGHADLLAALAGVNARLPGDWILLAVGRDDGIGDTLIQKADKLGLADKVSFMGARDDVADILRVSDIGLLCSHEEGFSNAILEGMAAGLPMVVTDVGGNAEAVVDGISGIVVPPHAPDHLGRAIKKLVNDPAMRKRMGAAGHERIAKHFSLDRCVDKYQKLYDEFDSGYVPDELSGKPSTD